MCCVGCCLCTKAGCYQDKNQVVYYSKSNQVNQDFGAMREINGSNPNPREFLGEGEVQKMEREERELLAGPKTGTIL